MLIADHLGSERKNSLSSDSLSSTSTSPAKHQSAVEDSRTVLDMTVSLCGMAAKKVYIPALLSSPRSSIIK